MINVQRRSQPDRHPRLARTEPWYDKSLFSQPTGANVDGFGNSRATSSARPSSGTSTSALFRSFPMGRVRPEIRIEATNVFNHTNWARPNLTFTLAAVHDLRRRAAAHGVNPTWGTAHP